MRKYKLYRPLILSRHPSHSVLRARTKNMQPLPFKSVVRLGSTTEIGDTIAKGKDRIEINSIQSIKNSASKLLMKQKFTEAGVCTAYWIEHCPIQGLQDLEFPIVAKSHYGSKGKGNTLLKTHQEYLDWALNKNLSNYIFEKFINYGHEFRLHITEDGCFYACRKALKADVSEDQKWRRHDDNCVWLLEENESFCKPNSWKDIENDCVRALKAIGADILSFDVKVQSPFNKEGNKREYQDYILLECNSASSMDNGTGELSICAKKYIKEITKLIIKKGNS